MEETNFENMEDELCTILCDFEKIAIVIPAKSSLYAFDTKVSSVNKLLKLHFKEIYKLQELQSLLLAKMGR